MIAPSLEFLVLAGVGLPAVLWVGIAGASLVDDAIRERLIGVTCRLVFLAVALALVTATALSLVFGSGTTELIHVGRWFGAGDHAFELRLLADPLSLSFASLCAVLLGVVAAFADRYLHREPGYRRFFANFALFAVGILLIALAGSIDVVFAGWELVGLASALLIAFFHERPSPVQSGLWTLTVYRVTDLGIVGAAILAHHYAGSGAFEALLGPSWPAGPSPLSSGEATAVALLLLFAVLGKGAQVPFSGWLPRAMEGPTPSSAIFYGALSVHAGAFLLLRAGPLLDAAPIAAAAVVVFGLLTAVHATAVGRVQSDIKSALAYASLTQVGIILVEIGVGLRWIPLIHILGHASIRALQILRAPSLLHDFHRLETAVGGHLPRTGAHLERILPEGLRRRLYYASLDRWRLDGALQALFVRPFLRLTAALDRGERWWGEVIGGATIDEGISSAGAGGGSPGLGALRGSPAVATRASGVLSEETASEVAARTRSELSKVTSSEVARAPDDLSGETSSEVAGRTRSDLSGETSSEVARAPDDLSGETSSEVAGRTRSELSEETSSEVAGRTLVDLSEETSSEVATHTTLEPPPDLSEETDNLPRARPGAADV
ncbi:MAG: proton-conducting transporter membrane subunit [Nannocystaceae bacterium]